MGNTLTDEEIVKALECCINSEGCDCENCPYNNNDDCQHRSGEDLLDLIHRLQNEIGCYIADQGILLQKIERLTEENEYFNGNALTFLAERVKLNAEIEFLSDENKYLHSKYKNDFISSQQTNALNDKLMDEKAELQKQVDELKNRKIEPLIVQCHAPALETCPKVEQAVKDAVKEILQEGENLLHECAMEYANAGHIDYFGVCENISCKVIRKIAKEKGVEVE